MDTHALHAVKKYDRVLINRALEVRKDLAVSSEQDEWKNNDIGVIRLIFLFAPKYFSGLVVNQLSKCCLGCQ